MRKKFKFKLEYRETSQSEFVEFEIDFVPYKFTKICGEYFKRVSAMRAFYDEIVKLGTKISEAELYKDKLHKEKKDAWKDEVKKCNERIEEIKQELERDYADLPEQKYDLIKLLLKKNNVEDEKFFKSEFWEECVDPQDANELITKAYVKDIDDNKKKLQSQTMGY